jgi:drug/metabolite transporter (DMT)-like permease
VCFYIGLAHTSGAKGSVLNASNAFFSIIVAHFLLKSEKITWRKALGCVIGFVGVIVINLAPGAWGSGFSLMGEGLILLCSFAYGTSSVTLKMISDRENPTTITAYQLLFGGAVLILIGLVSGGTVQGFELRSVILLIYMALLSTVAFSIWAALLKYNPVGKVSIFGFSIPVFGVALSALVLKEEIFTIQNLAALLLVSVGIIVVNVAGEKEN